MVRQFNDIRVGDVSIVGGKGANLGDDWEVLVAWTRMRAEEVGRSWQTWVYFTGRVDRF